MVELITNVKRPNIILNRIESESSDISTIGELNVGNGVYACDTLEDAVRSVKQYGITAIPSGIYKVALINSPKFGFVPHLLDVPYFTEILIHNGNHAGHSLGCILVGKYNRQQKNWVGESRKTLKELMNVLKPMNEKEELLIEIIGGLSKDQMTAS